jgi:hypothetical protein
MSGLNVTDLKSNELTEVDRKELEKVVGGDKITIIGVGGYGGCGCYGGGHGHAYGHYKP